MENFLKQTQQSQSIESKEILKNDIKLIDDFVEKNKNRNNFNELVHSKFPIFSEKYPALFKKLINQDCDRNQLEFVLNRLEQVRTGTKSQHDASVEVGQVLVDNYVKPKLAEKERREKQQSE